MGSIRTKTIVCTVSELGPFKHLMEETEFGERNCYLKCLNRGRGEIAVHPRADRAVHCSVPFIVTCLFRGLSLFLFLHFFFNFMVHVHVYFMTFLLVNSP